MVSSESGATPAGRLPEGVVWGVAAGFGAAEANIDVCCWGGGRGLRAERGVVLVVTAGNESNMDVGETAGLCCGRGLVTGRAGCCGCCCDWTAKDGDVDGAGDVLNIEVWDIC